MANFNTHFSYGATASAFLASTALSFGLASPQESLALWFAGSVGGMLPDIDADDSKAIRVLFNLFSAAISALWLFNSHDKVSLIAMWLGVLAIYISVRFVAMNIFQRFTVHRGSIHSLLVVCLVSAGLSASLYQLDFAPFFSWLAGLFLAFGCLVHLLLDELYSVDISNVRIKRSFGSALKIADFSRPWLAGLHGLALTVLVFFMPPVVDLIDPFSVLWQDPHAMSILPTWIADYFSPAINSL